MKSGSFVFLFLCLTCVPIFAQTVGPKKYWVSFADKSDSPFTLSQPEAFLSEKAINRREKQHIELKENDLPVNPGYISQVAATGAIVLNRSKWFNAVSVQVEDSTVLAQIQALPFVSQVNQVARFKLKTNGDQLLETLIRLYEQAQEKKGAKKQQAAPGSDQFYGDADKQIKMLNGNKLHDMGMMGQGITIAVLDGGFYLVNEFPLFDSLRASGRLLGTHDFVAGGNSVFEDAAHGMSVLSTMAGFIPGLYVGTAPKANYWLLRTEDTGSEYQIEECNWISAAEFADSVGADLINSSLGYTVFNDTTTNHTYSQLDGHTTRITIGADIAASKGILVVNSAGNSGADPWKYLGAPADGDSVLAIGAVTSEEAPASFSSFGPSADGRIKPNVSAMGQQTALLVSSGDIARSNGTSFSSPVIAGMSACLMQAHPEATAMQVFKAIEQSADQFENPDDRKGFGIPDYLKAHTILARAASNTVVTDSIVNVYPNPFIDGLTIEFYSNTEQQIEIEIRKVSGKLLASERKIVYPLFSNVIQMDNVRRLSAGMYIVNVIAGGKVMTRKVIKN